MLKFFRKIRKELIVEKKVSNYLLYAFGEIALVVVGILIALAIDNANDNRLKREKEQVYLKGLKEEFDISKIKLEELIKINRRSYEAAQEIVLLMGDGHVATEEGFSNLLSDAFTNDIFFNPNNSLLNEMINSGSLKDISNDTLRIRLTNWISTIDDIANQEKMLGEERNNTVNVFRDEGYSIHTLLDNTGMSQRLGIPTSKNPISNLGALESVAFENNLLLFIITSQSTEIDHYNPLMVSLNSILETINNELENK
ncbi:DUF6090 family protein [Flagellimonas oceanensis]|uniref:DUF6090 family protein n=1 Tax=Flagellimonas oceanensis TaxID=2499163 RepID=UPI000F8D4C9F|nr:DUF6090 family protein [Allomuricauda oceanensis]|tara:strand:- start:6532 stop:7299 length:768 start_codon:yes stop_codon:yes gene_type:complete